MSASPRSPRLLALLALANLVLTRPILAHAEANPDYFTWYGFDALDLLVVTAVLVFLPALLLWLPTRLAPALLAPALGVVGAAGGVQVAAAAGLGAAAQAAAALALGGAASLLARLPAHAGLRLGLVALALAPGVHFLLFSPVTPLVTGPGAAAAVLPAPRNPRPVVFVVFDELPLYMLLDEEGELDAASFPNFARLAAASTWFRQGTAVHTWTKASIPAILTGRYPTGNTLPVASQFPENLFSLLAGSHRLRVIEGGTSLLPTDAGAVRHAQRRSARLGAVLKDACILAPLVLAGRDEGPDLVRAAQRLTLFDGRDWFDRSRSPEATFEDLLAGLDGASPPGLHFLHSMVPHAPWRYLPDGQSYHHDYDPNALSMRLVPMADGNAAQLLRWSRDEWLVRHTYQRILLQARFVDRLLGRLIDRLQAQGMWDGALLVVTSDHGLVVDPGALLRELSPRPEGAPAPVAGPELDLLPVPFFVKRPGQVAGEVSDRNVSHVDLVPTIAAELGLDLPWAVDGSSVFAEGAAPAAKRAMDVDFRTHELPARLEGVAARGRRRRAWFAPGPGGSWVHRLLPHGDLVGRPAPEPLAEAPVAVTLVRPAAPGQGFLLGEVRGEPVAERGLFFALVHDGVVRAVSRSSAYDLEKALLGFFPEQPLPPAEELSVLVLGEVGGPARPRRVSWR